MKGFEAVKNNTENRTLSQNDSSGISLRPEQPRYLSVETNFLYPSLAPEIWFPKTLLNDNPKYSTLLLSPVSPDSSGYPLWKCVSNIFYLFFLSIGHSRSSFKALNSPRLSLHVLHAVQLSLYKILSFSLGAPLCG